MAESIKHRRGNVGVEDVNTVDSTELEIKVVEITKNI
jgi:hypothetical protein